MVSFTLRLIYLQQINPVTLGELMKKRSPTGYQTHALN
jgi:hypothetical protein